MKDRRLEEEYKEVFDNIHAPEYLKKNILKMKPHKRNYRNVIAFASTVAAAIAIFAAVGSYDFTNKDDSGVIKKVSVVENTSQTDNPLYTNSPATVKPAETETQTPEVTPTAKPIPDNTAMPAKKTQPTSVVKNTTAPLKSNKATQKPVRNNTPKPQNQERGKTSATAEIKTADEVNAVPAVIPTQVPQLTEQKVEQTEVPQISVSQSENINEPQISSEDNSVMQTAIMRSSGGGGGGSSLTVQTEEWENNRYFNYIGRDVVSEIEQNSDFVYIGSNANFVTVSEDGEIINDEWNFAFERADGGYINIITSKKGSDSSGALTEDDINSAISENGDSYSCQLRNNGIVYTVSATKLTKDEFTGLVKSLIL